MTRKLLDPPDLFAAALAAVSPLTEEEIARIGQDEAVTFRAVQIIAALHLLAMRLERPGISRRSRLLLSEIKRRCISFQNSQQNKAVLYKIGTLRKIYMEAIQSGKELCQEISPSSVEMYAIAFQAK